MKQILTDYEPLLNMKSVEGQSQEEVEEQTPIEPKKIN
jgi:hypothetical protein